MTDTLNTGQDSSQWTYHDMTAYHGSKRYELWNGTLVMTSAHTLEDRLLVKRLFKLFLAYDVDEVLGELLYGPSEVVLSVEWVVQPDILFISHARQGILGPRWILGGPDLVVEVESPCAAARNADFCQQRMLAYASANVLEYWLADAEAHTLTVYELDAANSDTGYAEAGIYGVGEMALSRLLPEVCIPVEKVFRNLVSVTGRG